MTTPRCILTVHAHPDDEASKGAGTIARYQAEGVRTVLVCCTGGEEGDIQNPAMDRPEIRENLAEVRDRELDEAARIIGYDVVVRMGYRDSGMPDTEPNARPEAFANAPMDDAVGRLVEVIRRERPQVIVTYGDDQQGYPHPDHLMVHDITLPAFERAGDPDWYPELGEPWQPQKLYYTMWSMRRILAMHEKFVELGIDSPFDEKWLNRPSHDERITTSIDISGFSEVRLDALLAHATQIDPKSPFWFGLPREVLREIHPYDEYHLAQGPGAGTVVDEDDLFAGLDVASHA